MINFCCEDTRFVFKGKRAAKSWLAEVVASEGKTFGDISIIFCSDAYLLELNKKYLNHDYFTDIITFDYCEGEVVSSDIFISVDSVRANAVEYGVPFENELHRVMVHGILHLVGYDDHSEEEVRVMRSKEDFYLAKGWGSVSLI